MCSDSYALQHLEPFCRTAKELTYHLASLCCGLEFGGESVLYKALQRSFEGKFDGERPQPPDNLGALTIAHMQGATTENRAERITEWARSVWEAFAEAQDAGRSRLKKVLQLR